MFTAQLTSGKKILSQNNLYFNSVKDLLLDSPVIRKSIKKTPEGFLITLTSNCLAKNVYMESGQKGSFSDNFFDLLPGETRTISFITKDINGDFEQNLKILTVVDTY